MTMPTVAYYYRHACPDEFPVLFNTRRARDKAFARASRRLPDLVTGRIVYDATTGAEYEIDDRGFYHA